MPTFSLQTQTYNAQHLEGFRFWVGTHPTLSQYVQNWFERLELDATPEFLITAAQQAWHAAFLHYCVTRGKKAEEVNACPFEVWATTPQFSLPDWIKREKVLEREIHGKNTGEYRYAITDIAHQAWTASLALIDSLEAVNHLNCSLGQAIKEHRARSEPKPLAWLLLDSKGDITGFSLSPPANSKEESSIALYAQKPERQTAIAAPNAANSYPAKLTK